MTYIRYFLRDMIKIWQVNTFRQRSKTRLNIERHALTGCESREQYTLLMSRLRE